MKVTKMNLHTQIETTITNACNLPNMFSPWIGYDALTNKFICIGGQSGSIATDQTNFPVYHKVWHSTDECATWTEVNADTRLAPNGGFEGGIAYSSFIQYGGIDGRRIWKILGGVYHAFNDANRTFPREIFYSDDLGTTWSYFGLFPGSGAQYCQLKVINNVVLVCMGGNFNIGGNIKQHYYFDGTRFKNAPFWDISDDNFPEGNRHAHTIWKPNPTIEKLMLGFGSSNSATLSKGYELQLRNGITL
jgi:hypothetical protein